jgi:cytochrome c biogenesis factor
MDSRGYAYITIAFYLAIFHLSSLILFSTRHQQISKHVFFLLISEEARSSLSFSKKTQEVHKSIACSLIFKTPNASSLLSLCFRSMMSRWQKGQDKTRDVCDRILLCSALLLTTLLPTWLFLRVGQVEVKVGTARLARLYISMGRYFVSHRFERLHKACYSYKYAHVKTKFTVLDNEEGTNE